MPCGAAKVALYYSKRMPTSSLATDPRGFLVDDLLHHLVISPFACIQSTHRIHLSVKFSQLEPNSQKINSEGEKQILWDHRYLLTWRRRSLRSLRTLPFLTTNTHRLVSTLGYRSFVATTFSTPKLPGSIPI